MFLFAATSLLTEAAKRRKQSVTFVLERTITIAMNQRTQGKKGKHTARSLAKVLAENILNNPKGEDYLLPSEHQLCRRFKLSRVTIRLALKDLEHRRLIYRRQGKGTFAHGCAERVPRNLGIFVKSPESLKLTPLAEMICGVQSVVASLHSSLVLLVGTLPEMAFGLSGIMVVGDDLVAQITDPLKKRHLPYLFIPESLLTLPDHDFFHFGERTAKSLYHAAAIGESVAKTEPPGLRQPAEEAS